MSDFRLVELRNTSLQVIDGDRGGNYPKKSEFKKNGHCIFLNANNVTSSGFEFDEVAFISQERDQLLRKGKAQRNDIVLTTRGTVGNVALYDENVPFDNIRINSGMVLLRADQKSIDSGYLFSFLRSATFQKQVASNGSGSAQPQLPIAALLNISLPLPTYGEQRKIAAVLAALDAKIDLNQRINAELEALAKTIYDYWFVQFDFPDAKGRPYKSSGGKMVWNEALKREIPAGWKARTLGTVISRAGTGLNPRDNFVLGRGSNYYVTIKNVTNGRIVLDDKCDRIDDESMAIIDRRSQLREGDVLFTSIEPVGVTYLIHEKPVNWNINESVFTIRPDTGVISPEYLLMLLSSAEMKAFTKNSSTGSIHKGIRHAVLKSFGLAYAGRELVDEYSLLLRPMLQEMDNLDKETRELTQLRDWLLPLLMNGQVRVA